MTDLHDLVAPYVLDALSPNELASFEAHLETCPGCQTELDELREGAVTLAESVAVEPPAHVKAAVMEGIESEGVATVTRLPTRRSASWLLAGAAAAVAIVFFGLWMGANSRLDDANQIAAVYQAPDAVIVQVETDNGPARFVYSPSLEAGVFNGSALTELGDEDVYQLWLIDPDGPDPAGTLLAGDADVLVTAAEPGLTLAMTVEPSPGADSPTTEPLFATEL